MTDAAMSETIELGDIDPEQWNDFALRQGWSDGFPLIVPTEEKVAQFVDTCRGDNVPFAAMSPRRVFPTLSSIAANAVMAGCRAEYLPLVVSAVRAVLQPEYNLHGTLATTHPCAPMLIINGSVRHDLDINCTSNCFGQGRRANATIGRALQLTLLNVGGAKPGEMDRATHGSPAKFAFCFGENEEESPWEAYHVRRGFEATDNVITALPCEAPHNINDHSSTSGEGILMTIAGTISQTGANMIYGTAPYVVALGPEHAATLHRDGWTIVDMQEKLFHDSAVHVSRVSRENQKNYEEHGQALTNDRYYLTRTPDDIQIVVAGGPGKHSAYIPTFGFTEACSQRLPGR
ncbi:MAG: hypothetical protein CFH40_01132 [Alphaproteobacteria bacterium MarineAlpha10_Bin3]|jgi:hypothetical protein|nr:MAG: hypothetical protein CFH40_01132 [Alphaproteobacteria bacterium MarineAlpha10_Bin3]PPR71649.1 MAG: hypothetical protein CFH09_01132 [Alphaproteobacteria bacterium MarineAlpha4_Bin1]